MKNIKNIRELELMQKNLEYQQLISEKKLLGTSANIVDDFSESLKDWAFEFGIALVTRLFLKSKKNRTKDD
ncbi:MAG: hypothetical protein JXR61_10550 [Prolixibacteraceae bacterium]|nr:hypothetical protein [Prolixibacteraceae bacterium]